MKNLFKRAVAVAMAAIAFVSFAPQTPRAEAQGVPPFNFPQQYVPVSSISTAVDTDPMLYIKYFGPGGTSTTTVAVAATSLTFVVNGAAYTGFECPVSGALGGIIDTSNAACDTAGEVIDIINATATTFSTGYFRAVIGAGTRSSTTNNTLLADAADSEVTDPAGEIVFWDSSTEDDSYIGFWDYTKGIANWIPGQRLVRNPWADSEEILMWGYELLTNGGTITNTEVHCTVENYVDGGQSSEVDRIIYLEAAGATTVVGTVSEFVNAGGLPCRGGKLWMRVLASGADTSAQLMFLNGYRRSFKPN